MPLSRWGAWGCWTRAVCCAWGWRTTIRLRKLTAFSPALPASSRTRSQHMVFKIAVVGLGKIATDQHLPCIAGNADFELVAGVSRNATLDNIPCFESLD